MMLMMPREMTDTEVRDQVERADAFREALRDAVADAIADLDPNSPCVDQARAGLTRIAGTLDQVDNIFVSNLSNIDAALRKRVDGGLMSLAKVRLMAVGCGPSLDYESADAFLATFQPMIDAALKRKRH
jgi:hypothetical protein